MKVSFVVSIELHPHGIELEAKRCGFATIWRATEAVVSDLENRLSDSIRHRDSVLRVEVQTLRGALKASA